MIQEKETKKVEKKEVKTPKTVEVKKEVKEVKKKFIAVEKKVKVKKDASIKKVQELLKTKKSNPVFRGRFGKKNLRRKNKDKWNKWRKPRGIDLDKSLRHGFRPKIGYRNAKEIRGIHPSGYKEVKVENFLDLEKVDPKTQAVRLGATVGKRKRNEIIKKANAKKIWILN
ncbi:MAG: eL32 family ribosomal protein [Candidatus ainarchaeum sp.]|nr:eL32 family ribosomal protein [Candidatus ainarchaeum sp.]